jgi:hypothetical protein
MAGICQRKKHCGKTYGCAGEYTSIGDGARTIPAACAIVTRNAGGPEKDLLAGKEYPQLDIKHNDEEDVGSPSKGSGGGR